MKAWAAALCVLVLSTAGCGGGGSSRSAPPPVVQQPDTPPPVVPPPDTTPPPDTPPPVDPPATTPPVDASLVSVQQLAPAGGVSTSAHYSLVFTLGPSVDSTAATSQHYRMQGGLNGADIRLP